jgi:hypothetical protein
MLPYNKRSDSLQNHEENLAYRAKSICMKYLQVGQMTTLPLELKWRYIPLMGTLVKTWYFSSGGHAFAIVCVLPTQAP